MEKDNRMTVLEFIDKYIHLDNKDDQDNLVKSIFKRDYAPILEKRVILQKMLDQSIVEMDNGIRYIDMTVSKINYTMALLVLYTNLNFDSQDGVGKIEEIYDALTQNNITIILCNYIGEKEITELNAVNQTIIDTFYNKYGSTEAFIGNAIASIGQKIGIASGWVISQIDEIITDKDKFNSLSEKFQEVLNMKR